MPLCENCGKAKDCTFRPAVDEGGYCDHFHDVSELGRALDALEALRNAGTLTDLPTGRFEEIVKQVDDVLLAYGRKVPVDTVRPY